jgi:hypothetical protein
MRSLLLRTAGCIVTGLVLAALYPMFQSLSLSEEIFKSFVSIAGLPMLLMVSWLINKYADAASHTQR